jgi:hypothetical protein
VLLKQPVVPIIAVAGSAASPVTLKCALLVWQVAQAGALLVSVLLCVYVPPNQGLGGCGAVVWHLRQSFWVAPAPR